jgi:hypothetical protein
MAKPVWKEVGDERLTVDRGAVLERVAVEQEIVRDGAALHAGEDRP